MKTYIDEIEACSFIILIKPHNVENYNHIITYSEYYFTPPPNEENIFVASIQTESQ